MKRVEVRWLDSVRREGGWEHVSAAIPPPAAMKHVTVGLLLSRSKRSVTVGLSSGRPDKHRTVCSAITIPRRAITRMRRL